MNILLLDDNLLTATRVKSSLEASGHSVALRRALPEDTEVLQAIVINLGSRSLKGLELVTSSRERFPGARLVGFCGHTEIEIRRAAKAAGMERIFTNEEALSGLQELKL